MTIMYRETEAHRKNAKYVKQIEEATVPENIEKFSQDAKDFAEYQRLQNAKKNKDDYSDLFKSEEEGGRWPKKDNVIIM